MRSFLRGDEVDEKRYHTSKWSELCKPIEERGLGIRKFKENNLALLAKTTWRCITTDQNLLCTKIIEEAKFNYGSSWFWRGFVNAVNFINDYVGWAIDGKDISVWDSTWIPCE